MDSGAPSYDCVILAAGVSSRMGRPKLLLPFRGTTVIGAVLQAALDAGLRPIVVSRIEDEKLRDIVLAREGAILAVNPDPGRGMLSSLQAGVARVASERFFFLPADMPFVGPGVYRLLKALESASPIIPTAGGRKGHPVLMPSALIQAILDLKPDESLRTLMAASGAILVETGDEGVLRDIDTARDYAEATKAARGEASGA